MPAAVCQGPFPIEHLKLGQAAYGLFSQSGDYGAQKFLDIPLSILEGARFDPSKFPNVTINQDCARFQGPVRIWLPPGYGLQIGFSVGAALAVACVAKLILQQLQLYLQKTPTEDSTQRVRSWAGGIVLGCLIGYLCMTRMFVGRVYYS
jgi:hypothetical protein